MTQPSHSNLKAQVSSGIFWSGAARVVQQVVQFGLSVVLARLLSPGDYGLMAMVAVFTGFAGMLADAGFNSALIQKKDMTETHAQTVFWVTLMAGGLLTGITFVAAPWLARFYHTPLLTPIFRIVAVNFLLGGLGNVPSALLQKRMQFRTIAKIDTASMILSGIVGVVLACRGYGVWSLVVQTVMAALLTSVFRCWNCRWLPKLAFSWAALKDIWGFSGHLYGFNFINYWARNADNLMIGKFFGAPVLGAYNRAIALMLLPISQINGVISQVIFSAFSSIQDDKERVKRIYLRAMSVVALLAFPIMMGLLVVAEPFVLAVYGAKWGEVIGLLQILAFVGVMQTLGNSVGWLFLSQGRSDLMFFWGTFYSVSVIAAFAVGVMLGSVKAVAICYMIVNVIFFFPELIISGRLINLKINELLLVVAGPFFVSLIMAVMVAGVHLMLPADWPAWQTLTVLVGTGAVIYMTFVYFLKLSAGLELLKIIQEKRMGK